MASYVPYKRKNKWVVAFPSGILMERKTTRSFPTEEEARKFVLKILPDAYDEKIEIERKCSDCNQILPVEYFRKDNKTKCRSCVNKYRLILLKDRRNNNVCSRCNNIRLPKSEYCYEHWFSKASVRYFKSSKYTIELINLYEKQNRKCVYTGVNLIPNENMSLDHIISVHDNKELYNDIKNVQWIHKDINWMKSKFSHDNFIKLCKHIASRF